MIIKKFSKKINQNGCVILPTKNKDLFNLDNKEISNIFKNKGFILFRNFKFEKEKITSFTDKFTKKYANDAYRRISKFDNNKIKTVDEGNEEMPLHSEASYSPSWPEIVWFYCNKAPKKSGFTTICDGKMVYKNLKTKTKEFFLANQIIYDLRIPFGHSKTKSKKKLKKWLIDSPGVSGCKIDLNNKEVYLKYKRYAVIKVRNGSELAFVNHLQFIIEKDPQVLSYVMENYKKIPKDVREDYLQVCKKLTEKIIWKSGDLVMIDNKRLMHGRTKILSDEIRDIVNIQTLECSF
jgi:alpha-ketoglutarate-dependent taurine dioxygenase